MLFVHGHQFIKKDEEYYTSGSLNNNLFKRYIDIFENVSVFANQKIADENDKRYINSNNKVTNVNLILMNKKNNIFEILKNRNEIKEYISKENYIVIRIPSFYGFLAVYYSKKMGKSYLIELVGCPWDAYWNHSIKGKIIAPFMWTATKLSIMNSPYVLYVTSNFLQMRYPTKGLSVGCSDVALPNLDEQILKNRLDKIYNMQSIMSTVIGTIGVVDIKYKGQEYVIEAISKLNKEGYHFEYHIVGGGDSNYLRSVAKKYNVVDQVKFHGSLPHEEIFKWLDTIDIYIQPSMTEGLPRALVEAMSRGCPSIGSNVGGIPELVSSEFIFKAKDVNDLLEKLIKMNKENMLKEAEKNFNKAKEFDKHLLNKKRIEFYRSFKEGINSHD